MLMAAKDDPIIIKKYANRRLYNTGTSTYVTLEDLAEMVKKGEEFTVQDAKTGDDITHPVLTQIIFELENKDGQNMLPIPFLRQLIAFYGDQMQQIKALEEQTRRNMEMFQNAMRLFTPFPTAASNGAAAAAPEPARKEAPENSGDLQELKEQIAAMQRKLDTMS
jgi:polyhydroxyalkanoate synthesis repressor PhaR